MEMRRESEGMPVPPPLAMEEANSEKLPMPPTLEERPVWWSRLFANPFLGPPAKAAIFLLIMLVVGINLAVIFAIISVLHEAFTEGL